MKGVVNIEDLRKLAKKRLPKIAYDFIEGGTDDEVGLVTNEQAFRQARIVPRYLVDVSVRDQSTTLFGRTYSSPIGIAPTGLAGLFRRGADLMLAEAARDANVPFIMSGASTGSIEDLGKLAPDHGWYQLYSSKDEAISEDLIKRVGDAGLKTLVFTVDVPEGSNRERNTRNGWGRPLKLNWSTKLEALEPDQLGAALQMADKLETFINDARKLAVARLEKSMPVPGYKLVAKRATRQWADEAKADAALAGLGVTERYKKELISPAQAKKVLKKSKLALPDDLVVAVSSGSTLAPESDPRPAVLNIGTQLVAALSKLQ